MDGIMLLNIYIKGDFKSKFQKLIFLSKSVINYIKIYVVSALS